MEEEENAPAQNPWRQSNDDNGDLTKTMTIAMMIVITISIEMVLSQKNNKTNCSRQDMENFPLLQPSKFAPTSAITIW